MTTTEPRNPFTRRGFIAAALIIGIIALAALIVLVTSLTRPTTNDAPPTGTPSPTASPTANASDASVCGLPGFEKTSSLTTAPDNKWELVGTVAAPTDPTGTGPGIDDGGFLSCYSHTAEGALYAAVNFVALGTDSRNSSKIYELLSEGKARDAVEAAGDSPSTPSSARLQVAGFKVDAYTATDATIDIAWSVTSEGAALVSVPTVLHWEEGDWKIVLTESGAPISPGPISNLGGYIPWAGV